MICVLFMLIPKPLVAYFKERYRTTYRTSHQKLLLADENIDNNRAAIQIEMQQQVFIIIKALSLDPFLERRYCKKCLFFDTYRTQRKIT